MATIFIFHGVGGSPQENWFPWLSNELAARGHRTIVPHFPHTDKPKLEEWLEAFASHMTLLDANAVLIGHSLGGAFALRLLERFTRPIRATFLVASVWGLMENAFDPLMMSFTQAPYDWAKIRRSGGMMRVYHGENDPYITRAKSEELAANLGTGVTLIPSGGHLNTTAGFATFPQLLRAVESNLLA